MDTGRLVALVRSMAHNAMEKKDAEDLVRLAGLLSMLKSERLEELEKELASRNLKDRYKNQLLKKVASR